MTVCVTRTDLDTDSLHSLITPLGVTPVPSTVSLITGPIPGFTVRRLLSLVASQGETDVPGDCFFYHGIPVPGFMVRPGISDCSLRDY